MRQHPLTQLGAANLRGFLRDKVFLCFVLVLPFLFLGLFAVFSSTGDASAAAPSGPDAFRFGLPAVLALSFVMLALFGTATNLIQLRHRGTMRLLRTTPLPTWVLIAAEVPGRLAIGSVQLAVLLMAAGTGGYLSAGDVAGLVVTCLLGLAMLFSFGFLVGGLIRSPDLGNGGLAALMPIVLIFSGVLMPLQDLPATARNVARWIPFAYLGDALRQDLTGMPGTWSRPVGWAVIVGTTLLVTVITLRTFRWE